MKKLLLILTLILLSVTGKLYAQNRFEAGALSVLKMSKEEKTFDMKSSFISLRDFIELKEGKMILDLADLKDYESFRNLDSVLKNFRKDVAFYKDSLDATPTAGVRIDYVVSDEYPFKKIRFKKYNSGGNIYLNQGGDISRLKYEQDTVNIIMQKSELRLPGPGKFKIPYAVSATFVLANYTDVDKIVAGRELKRIVDTLEKTSQLKRTIKSAFLNPLTIYYSPYNDGKWHYKRLPWLSDVPYDIRFSSPKKRKAFAIDISIGAGLIRNDVAPMGEIGAQFTSHQKLNHKNHDYFRISATPYFLFDKDSEGNSLVNDNWFLNADVGSVYDGNEATWLGKRVSFGVGYLVKNKGGYFKNNTFKVFTDLEVVRGLTICPELIFNNNFKQIFPGITVKVF